ncbi:hypothetical protein ROZALSC1DRAFT_21834 [Rozella allomycis CSF55]|uniref:RING-type E3 ubiquitin transferase (cysteine targeting) n=1 Tax=Rozella allomycis (strain CSF55) TaxID=988480 RepID=A0A4P9YK27_ROZAC|nr:hypothetical protein ROZALSC1DRAFT_21834 [Rozella allomycis CSF55]
MKSVLLDAQSLDLELENILQSRISNALSQLNGNFKYKYKSIITFVIRCISFYYNISKRNASYGDELQNLVYSKSESKKTGLSSVDKRNYFMWNVLLPLCWSKCKTRMPLFVADYNEEINSAFELLNFLLFLKDEKYRTWFERLFGFHSIVNDDSLERMIVLEFTDRQMIWNVLSEFLTSIMPLLSSLQIESKFKKIFSHKEAIIPSPNQCGICLKQMVIRQKCSPCGHVFCYHCIESLRMESFKAYCPMCSVLISSTEREK